MKNIVTGKNRCDSKRNWEVMVDDADFDFLNQFSWAAYKDGTIVSAMGNKNNKHIILGRLLLQAPDNLEIDHIDGNRLNNQRSNLRLATSSQNKCNRGARKDNKSGYKGVSWHKQVKKWTARIKIPFGAYLFLGTFTEKIDAAKTYDKAAKKYHGEFAWINIH